MKRIERKQVGEKEEAKLMIIFRYSNKAGNRWKRHWEKKNEELRKCKEKKRKKENFWKKKNEV